jgi:hypothetical protein
MGIRIGGEGGRFSGVKRWEREADHSPPLSVEVKNDWIHTYILIYVFAAYKSTTLTFFIFMLYNEPTNTQLIDK